MTPYQPRAFRFEGLLNVGALQLKCYRIDSASASLADSDRCQHYEQAMTYAEKMAQSSLRSDAFPHHGLGYLIVHFGAQRIWLLLHWWHGEDIVLAHLASASLAGGVFRCEDEQPLHACVWEHVAIHHEREAWVRHMLTSRPDAAAYLEDRLPDGRY